MLLNCFTTLSYYGNVDLIPQSLKKKFFLFYLILFFQPSEKKNNQKHKYKKTKQKNEKEKLIPKNTGRRRKKIMAHIRFFPTIILTKIQYLFKIYTFNPPFFLFFHGSLYF